MMLYPEKYYDDCYEQEEKRRTIIENILYSLGVVALLVALFFAWWLAPVFACADELEEDEPKDLVEKFVFCQPDSYVNIRASASKHGIEEGRLYLGDNVFVDRTHGQWSHCVGLACEAGEGWIKSEFLGEMEPEVFTTGMKMRTTKGAVNARVSVGGKVRKKLGKGATVTVWASADDWSVTNQGMIMTDLLEVVTE